MDGANAMQGSPATGAEPILEIRDLHTHFQTYRGLVRALNGVDMTLYPGEVLGVVGETGSGKSVTGLSILKLIRPPGRIVRGEIICKGRDLLRLSEEEMRSMRGCEIGMIFQSPRRCLNPVFNIGNQMAAILQTHRRMRLKEALAVSAGLLKQVGLYDPERILKSFPHELSSGMCQRVMIAMALSCKPFVLIADEPTTGLDVTLQVQIMSLIRERVNDVAAACILITHDLGVVAENTRRTIVMYGGRVVESALTEELFENPRHPYTSGLLKSVLRTDVHKEIHVIRGMVPNLINMSRNCAFYDRCDEGAGLPACKGEAPPVVHLSGGRQVRCHLRVSDSDVVRIELPPTDTAEETADSNQAKKKSA